MATTTTGGQLSTLDALLRAGYALAVYDTARSNYDDGVITRTWDWPALAEGLRRDADSLRQEARASHTTDNADAILAIARRCDTAGEGADRIAADRIARSRRARVTAP